MSHSAGNNVELVVVICNASSAVPKPHPTSHSMSWNVTKKIMFRGEPSNATIIGKNGLIVGNRDLFVLVSCSSDPCPIPVAGASSITVGQREIQFDEAARVITFSKGSGRETSRPSTTTSLLMSQ